VRGTRTRSRYSKHVIINSMTTREAHRMTSPHQPTRCRALPRCVWSRAFRSWLLALVLVIVTFAAYQPAWHAGFIWDDDSYVTENQALRSLDGLGRIWVKPGTTPRSIIHWSSPPSGRSIISGSCSLSVSSRQHSVARLECRSAVARAAPVGDSGSGGRRPLFALHP